MTERWRSELVKLRSARFGDDLWDRILEGPQLATQMPRRRGRPLTIAVAAAVAICAAVLVWVVLEPLSPAPVELAGSNRLVVPPRGEAAAVFLADGHPAFVVHDPDGAVAVIDALSPRRIDGVSQLLGWCSAKPYFLTWPDPSFFDRNGGWTGGAAAIPGVRAYSLAIQERDAAGDPTRIRVLDLGLSNAGGHMNDSSVREYPSGCGLAGGDANDVVRHVVAPSEISPTPADAVAVGDRWAAVRGALRIRIDGSVELCSATTGPCADGAVVDGVDGSALERRIATDGAIGGSHVWLVHVEHGAIVGLAPTDDWR